MRMREADGAMKQATRARPGKTVAVAPETNGADGLRLRVATPADNAQFDLPEVSPETTPAEVIEQLIQQGFLPAPSAGRAYVMAIRGGQLLAPDQSLGAAGVPSGATLQIFTDTPGASP